MRPSLQLLFGCVIEFLLGVMMQFLNVGSNTVKVV